MGNRVYKNTTELMELNGVPVYMNDAVDACLRARLNLFLQGDTGTGKTQLARDAMGYFKDKSLFILGRNDMDTRELFQQINLGKLHQTLRYNLEPLINPETGEVDYYYPKVDEKGIFVYQKLTRKQAEVVRGGLEKLAGSTEDIREVTSKINTQLFVTDELPNCVPAVRAQLFNLYDGIMEIGGKAYPIGNYLIGTSEDAKVKIIEAGIDMSVIESLREDNFEVRSDAYSVGIATGNLGQKFTESSNELGRALKDRMHVIIDVDYFFPKPSDTLEILAGDTNPRVEFTQDGSDSSEDIIKQYQELVSRAIPLEKLIIANYLLHGLDYCSKGSKREMRDAWPTQLESHEQGSDVGLVLPVSPRAAKSILRFSQALDDVIKQKGAKDLDYFESMMQAYKFVAAYSGVLNEAGVQNTYVGDRYKALDAVISTTKVQFDEQTDNIGAGLEMVQKGKRNAKVLNLFKGRWQFMKDTLEGILKMNKTK